MSNSRASSNRSSEPSCVSSHGGFLRYDSEFLQTDGCATVSAPFPLHHVSDRLLAAQRILNPTLLPPVANARALMLLSRPVASVMLADEVATVLEFYGIYWVLEVGGARTGFFNTEDDAVCYLQNQMSVADEREQKNG